MDFITATVFGTLTHSEDSHLHPQTLKTGLRPNHRFPIRPTETFIGEVQLLGTSELHAGESSLAVIKIIAAKTLEPEFKVNNSWELCNATAHIGSFTISNITAYL